MPVQDVGFYHPVTKLGFSKAASGDNELVAAAGANKIIRVVYIAFICAGAVTVRFESAAGGTALSGQMQYPANGGLAMDYCQYGYLETLANQALNLELSAAVSVDGFLGYQTIETGVI